MDDANTSLPRSRLTIPPAALRQLEAIVYAVIIADLNGNIVGWNRAAERLFGRTAAEAIGQSVASMTHNDLSRQQAMQIMMQISRGETWEGELVAQHRDGSPFIALVSGAPYRDEAGSIVGGISLSREIGFTRSAGRRVAVLADLSRQLGDSLDFVTATKQVASALVPSFADLCSIVVMDDSDDPKRVAVSGVDGGSESLLKRSDFANLPPSVAALVRQTMNSGHAQIVPEFLPYLTSEGASRDAYTVAVERVGATAALLAPLVARGRTLGVLAFGMTAPSGRAFEQADVLFAEELGRCVGVAVDNAHLHTRLLESEAAAVAACERARIADQQKDRFLAMLGHELRNPLAPIVTALELMTTRGPPSREQEIIRVQVEHLVGLVDDLLDVSRFAQSAANLEKRRLETSQVLSSAIEIASPVIEERSHTVALDIARDGLSIDGDPRRLAQAISNLLVNAAKYTDPGGHIRVRAWRDEDYVAISVADDGRGIARDAIGAVFEPFVQGAQPSDRPLGGVGIGLTLVRSFVEAHGGSVSVASDGLGRGSEFVVRLPRADTLGHPPPARAIGTESSSDRIRGDERVLVVDDNADALEMLAEGLRYFGHEVATAEDGPTGLRLAESFLPDVAVLDIGLPGMDGYELAQRLRTRNSTLRLVALTGYGQPGDRERSRRAGFDAHLVKPVDLDRLEETISRTD